MIYVAAGDKAFGGELKKLAFPIARKAGLGVSY